MILWLLLEAARFEDGKRFGPIGSIILGDAFYAALANEPAFPVTGLDEQEVEDKIFGKGLPKTMPELVKFVNIALKLEGVEPRFM